MSTSSQRSQKKGKVEEKVREIRDGDRVGECVCLCVCVCMYVWVCVCLCVCMWVCACGVWPRTKHAPRHDHCVRGLSTSVPKRASADHHGNWWSATGVWEVHKMCVCVCLCVDVAKCHASHAKSSGVTGNKARHQSQPSAISGTLATQSEGRCRQAPRLPRKVERRHREPSAPPEPGQCHKWHAGHAKWRSMSPSATSATQSEGRCRQAPRLPRKVERRRREPSAPPEPAQCHKCHACDAKWRSMSPSGMSHGGSEHQLLRLQKNGISPIGYVNIIWCSHAVAQPSAS